MKKIKGKILVKDVVVLDGVKTVKVLLSGDFGDKHALLLSDDELQYFSGLSYDDLKKFLSKMDDAELENLRSRIIRENVVLDFVNQEIFKRRKSFLGRLKSKIFSKQKSK